MMKSLELCAGHGGGLLGNILLGHTTVCAVEREPACITSLRARQAQGFLPEFPIHDDVRTFNGRPWRGSVDILSGGIPCQGFSGAGKQLGEFDPRNLWPDALRILKECRAPWFFLENVDRLTSFDYWGVILQDLASAGYDARWCVLSAGDVGAPHLRKRIWLLATDTGSFSAVPDAKRAGLEGHEWECPSIESGRDDAHTGAEDCTLHAAPGAVSAVANADEHASGSRWESDAGQIERGRNADRGGECADQLADTAGERCREARHADAEPTDRTGGRSSDMGHAHHARPQVGEGERSDTRPEQQAAIGAGGRSAESNLGRMADGVANQLDRPGWWAVERGLPRVAGKQSHRADRLRGCGNGQVALCKAVAWRLLGGP